MLSLEQIIPLIAGAVILIALIVYLVINQKKKIIEWLKYAVSEAEKEMGSGTGQLKLRMVYDWYCEKFPFIAALLPFKVFSSWVDVALETMRKWLDENNAVAGYIGGTE